MLLLAVSLWIFGGCAAAGAPEPAHTRALEAACKTAEGELAPDATLADDAGTYRLTLVRTDGPEPLAARGQLTLSPRPVSMRRVDGWTAPLAGSASVDLQAVGATTFGSVESDDPMAPGVLVLESAGDPPTILLRLGSSANRADLQAFDEASTALTVRAIEEDGFMGSWRSVVRTSEVSGHFCAARAG